MHHFPLLLFLSFLSFSFAVGAQDTTSTKDLDHYFAQLPDTCFYLCNWREYGENLGVKHIGAENRSLSFRQHRGDEFPPSFQMAIFEGRDGQTFVVVSNQECEAPECLRHDSYFFLHRDGHFVRADSLVLPNLGFAAFYDDPVDAEVLGKYPNYGDLDFVLKPAKGEVEVELLVCDYLQFDYPEVTDEQYERLISNKKAVTLQWNEHRNRFEIK
jgi:hypothetical protein